MTDTSNAPDLATSTVNEEVVTVMHEIIRENDPPAIARSLRIYEATMQAYAPTVRVMQSMAQSVSSATIVASSSRATTR